MLDHRDPDLGQVIATRVAPAAATIDREGVYPDAELRALGAAGAFAHHTGSNPDMGAAIEATAKISAACLSTGFSTWCQNALALYLDRSANTALRDRLGTDVATGRLLGGTGLSNPMKSFSGIEPLALVGARIKGGYRVRGRLPWVSNIARGHFFAVVFAVEGQPPVMAVVATDTPGVTLHEATRFIALDGTATHTVTFRDVVIPDEDLIAETASEFIPTIRQSFVALQLGLAFGLSDGALAAMRSDTKGAALASAVRPGVADYAAQLEVLKDRAIGLMPMLADTSQQAFHNMLALRRDAALLTLDITRAETIQAGSRGYVAGAPSERRSREAAFIAILTPSIKHIATEIAS